MTDTNIARAESPGPPTQWDISFLDLKKLIKLEPLSTAPSTPTSLSTNVERLNALGDIIRSNTTLFDMLRHDVPRVSSTSIRVSNLSGESKGLLGRYAPPPGYENTNTRYANLYKLGLLGDSEYPWDSDPQKALENLVANAFHEFGHAKKEYTPNPEADLESETNAIFFQLKAYRAMGVNRPVSFDGVHSILPNSDQAIDIKLLKEWVRDNSGLYTTVEGKLKKKASTEAPHLAEDGPKPLLSYGNGFSVPPWLDPSTWGRVLSDPPQNSPPQQLMKYDPTGRWFVLGPSQPLPPLTWSWEKQMKWQMKNRLQKTKENEVVAGAMLGPIAAEALPIGAPVDPLIIDLDNDGFELSTADGGIFIQQNSEDEFAFSTSWLSDQSGDGILFFDTFNDGILYSAEQLFGDRFKKTGNVLATDGFDALASLDSNEDGIIDESDEDFDKIRVALADDTSISLEEAGIVSIDLNATSTNQTDLAGNVIRWSSTVTRDDASTSTILDYDLAVDTLLSNPVAYLAETPAVSELPEVLGFGTMYNLRQAMVRDTSGLLTQYVSDFASATSASAREELLSKILYRWSDADSIATNHFGAHIDARHVVVVNRFRGENFDNFITWAGATVVGSNAARLIDDAFWQLSDMVFGQLMLQSHLQGLAEEIEFEVIPETNNFFIDLSGSITFFETELTTDRAAGEQTLTDFIRALKGVGLLEISNFADFQSALLDFDPDLDWVINSAGFNRVLGTSSADLISVSSDEVNINAVNGGSGNDTIYSSNISSSVVFGGDGDDIIHGGFWRDLLSGGSGNDHLFSGAGQQTFLFNRADGQDTVTQMYSNPERFDWLPEGAFDILRFGPDIDAEDLLFEMDGTSLVISIKESTDKITIENQFSQNFSKRVDYFQFLDGTELTFEEIIEAFLSLDISSATFAAPNISLRLTANESNSVIVLGDADYTVNLGSADYQLSSGSGYNTFNLSSGNAHLDLGESHNKVIFGTGNAEIVESFDTEYFYFEDSGSAIIHRISGSRDVFHFGNDIAQEDLIFTVVGADLHISSSLLNGELTFRDQLSLGLEPLSFELSFEDENALSWSDLLDDLAYLGTSAGETIDRSAETTSEIINGLGGNDTITAGSGNDTIVITQGDQTVSGGEGDNIYIYSPGNGEAVIDESSGVNAPGEADTLIFTKGIYQAGTYFTASGNDLIISFRGSSDQITILGELLSSPTRVIDTFKFSTGVELSLNDIITASFNPAAQDQFVYKASSENDSFDFALNDGLVTIIDGRYGNDEGENDTLVFGAGIGHSDLLLSSSGSSCDLAINIDGTNDTVTITNELLTGDLKRVGLFDFNVDSNLTLAQLLDMHAVQVSSSIDNDNIDRRLSFANENIVTTGENATIYAGTGDNTITDEDGDATIVAGSGTSIIDAGAGINVIDLTNDGDATIALGEGNNTVYDGAGNTTYQVNLGSGDSVIYQQTTDDNPGDSIIEFGADITLNDLTLQAHGMDLTLNITGGQSILLKSGLSSDLFKNISQFNFTEDSTSYSLAQLLVELPPEVIVTNDNWLEDRHFTFADETISLEGSNDRLNVGSGDVAINVSGDNNRIFAGAGDNEITIEEGALDTFINVGGGSTNIHIEKGTGHTVVAEFLTANMVGNNDHITLGTGIDDNDIVVTAKGQDITLAFNNTEEDQLTLQNALNLYQAKQISDITFADSTVMDLEDILALGVTFYEEDDFRTVGNKDWTFDKTVNASGDYQKIHLGEGTDILNVTGKNATVYGGAGEATVNFEDGMGSVVFFEDVVPGTSGNNDAVSFGGTLDLDDVRLTYNDAGDLILWFDGTNDIINFRDQFDSAQKEIEQFTFNDGAEVLSRSELFDRTFYFTMEGDNATMYHTFDFNEVIVVNSNNAMLNLQGEGESYDVTINGDSAWVQLYGSESTVTINGADAEIYAGGPSNTFILNEGFGNLFIDEDISSMLPNIDDDHIVFGEGFDVEDMILSYDQTGAALLISFVGSTDHIRIDQQMYSSPFKTVEDFTFADATVLTFADILAEGVFYFTYDADDDGDTHFGTLNENVTINGNNVHFNAADGTNTITINGDDGWVQVADGNSTVIVNGADAEIYTGMNGEQTFVVNAGTGNVFISETYGGSGALPNDHLVFGEGISFDDIYLTYVNSTDLVIGVIGTNDTVTIDEQVSGSAKKRVGDFTFGATTMSYNDLLANGRFYFYLNTDNDGLNHFGSTNEYIELNGYNDMLWDNNGDNIIVLNGDSAAADLGDGEKRVIVNGANAEIWAGYDSNTFELNAGFGNLIIENVANNTHSADDHIIFGEGIDVEDVHFTFDYNDLFVTFDGSSDVLEVELQMYSTSKKIADFTFADETVLTWADVLDAGFEFTQTANNNTLGLNGTNYNANITSTGTNDTVYTSNGRNLVNISGSSAYVYMGSGVNTVNSTGDNSEFLANSSSNATINSSGDNDKIYAGSGANHISIEGNNSVIYGGTGHSDISLTSGIGPLTIYEQNSPSVSGNHDLVMFDNTFDKEDMWVSYISGSWDLVLGFEGTSDKITVINQVNGSPYKYVDFKFADNTTYNINDILDMSFRFDITSNNQYMDHSYTSVDELFNISGNNDTVRLGAHANEVNITGSNATIYGGAGHSDINLSSGLGNSVIYEQTSPAVSGTVDTIFFDSSFDSEDMWVSYNSSGDLIVNFDGMTDSVRITNQLSGSPTKKIEVEFADSTHYSWNDIAAMDYRFDSSANGDYFYHVYTGANEIFNLSGANDTVYLGSHTNVVNLSGANAIIYGGAGHSDINLTAGIGPLRVYEYTSPSVSGTVDTIYFDNTFDRNDMWVSYDSTDLLVNFTGMTDTVKVTGQMSSSPTKKIELEFADSEIYTWTEIKDLQYRFTLTSGTMDHYLSGVDELVSITGNSTTFYTGYGDNVVNITGNSNNTYAWNGSSVFNVSGSGNNARSVSGQTSLTVNMNTGGNNFYSSSKKSVININADTGTHAIYEYASKSTSGDKDEVHFDDDVVDTDIAFYMNGNNLELSYNGNSDIVTIYNQNVSSNQVSKLVLDDGQFLTAADINQVISDMSTYASNNSISFSNLSDVQGSSALMNIIATAWHT